MGSHLGIRREVFSASEDQSWLGSAHGTDECDSITLDSDAFLTLFPTGIVPSGVVLYKHSSGLYRPFGSVSADEQQTITEGGSGLTSFVLHFNGDDTTALAAASTAAQVQAALEALESVGVGNVAVTGGAGGPYTVVFGGDLADSDQPAMTATPTGGTGTVTIATSVPGGTDTDTAAGLLFTTTDLGGTTAGTVDRCTAALFWHGEVIVANLPENAGLTTGARADLNQIRFI